MRKYYSFIIIIICALLVNGILILENKKRPSLPPQKQEEYQKDNRLITQGLSPNSKLIIKNQALIQSGDVCFWSIENNTACGIYCKKSYFPKILLKETELVVEWITTKKVLLPGFVLTSENKDTTIFARTKMGKEIYIVLVSGENLELIKKRNRVFYSGASHLSTMEDLKTFFELKIQ